MSEKPVASIKTLARYEPDIVYIGTGEYVAECVRADDGDYYLAADVDAAIEPLLAERDVLARENEAMRRCAIKYLGWLGVTHKPLDAALREDMENPDMCGDAALNPTAAQENDDA